MGAPIQKLPPEWPELVPSLPGAYDGRVKWAAVDVMGGSVAPDSVTTPSWGDEAQAESSHATTKANIPHNAERFFTKSNLAMVEPHATSGSRELMPKETRHEKILRERFGRVHAESASERNCQSNHRTRSRVWNGPDLHAIDRKSSCRSYARTKSRRHYAEKKVMTSTPRAGNCDCRPNASNVIRPCLQSARRLKFETRAILQQAYRGFISE